MATKICVFCLCLCRTDQLQDFLVGILSHIENASGKALDRTAVMPLLATLFSGYPEQLAEQKFRFTGVHARIFALSNLFVKHFPELEDRVLEAFLRRLTDPSQLYKHIVQEYNLKKYVLPLYSTNIIDHMIGIFYRLYGIQIVEKFIERAVLHIVDTLVNGTSCKSKNPIWELNNLVATKHGDIKYSTTKSENNAETNVMLEARFGNNCPVFSHSRSSFNKQKAKTAACSDVLQFLNKHPDIYEQLVAPAQNDANVVYPLAIPLEEYTVLPSPPQPSTPTPRPSIAARSPLSSSSNDPVQWSSTDEHHTHIKPSDYHDSIQALSELLLGNDTVEGEDVDMAESPTKRKRSKDVLPNNQSPFIQQEPDLQSESQHLLNVIKQPSPTQSTVIGSLQPLGNPLSQTNPYSALGQQPHEKVFAESRAEQVGPSHAPLFTAEVILKSKQSSSVFLRTEGLAKRKKDAEQTAFYKLVQLLCS
ncbi:hypothetical protein BD560DRAFT_489587 [Blakeslea trispora]|nr:hypothetical protein BD560DRAFT_489587 [Blakeslea trispora]